MNLKINTHRPSKKRSTIAIQLFRNRERMEERERIQERRSIRGREKKNGKVETERN